MGGGVGDIPVAMIGAGERSNKTPPVVFQFSGSIDEVYIYDRALSPSEVATLFAVPEPPPHFSWELDWRGWGCDDGERGGGAEPPGGLALLVLKTLLI